MCAKAISPRPGEIYPHARFHITVPATLVEEFNHLETRTFAAVEKLGSAEPVRR